MIDFVYCNDAKDASGIIKLIKPNFYVKGPDYKKIGDEAGNLVTELRAIKKVKGKFLTTSNVQYSSTNIINKKLNYFNSDDLDWLKKIKRDSAKMDYLSEFSKVLEKIKKQNVLIIGEIILMSIIMSTH